MRIVSLLPAATEIVAALGLDDQLVGITHECDHPPSVLGLPRVTRSAIDGSAPPGVVDRAVRERDARGEPLYTLDEALIEALAPDLIITQGVCAVCAVSEGDVRAVAARRDPPSTIITLSGSTLDEVLADIGRVGATLGLPDAAATFVARLRERMQRVHERLAAAAAPRPRVVVLEWTDPLFAAGHWVPRLVRRAGGEEVLATEGQRSRSVAIDSVIAAEPEVVIIAPCGYDAARAAVEGRRLLALPEWAPLRSARAWAVDANALLSRPGPRLVDGIETLAAILHPSLFPQPTEAHAIPLSA
jgi:iron complex transport system substrate-binding protein